MEKQKVAISGLEDIEVEGVVQTKLPDELQKEVEVGETPKPPSGLDVVLESVHDALKKDFLTVTRVFDHYCACQNFLKIKSKRASRGSMDTLQSSAVDTLDSSLQSLDSPTVASLESTVMSPLNSPSASVVGFFSSPESANYVEPANLFGLHEPHFRVLFREIGLKLPGRKARKTFERAAEGPSLTRATFLHALVRLALRASKKRPHQAISKLMGRVAKTPAAADDNHRAKLFYSRDTERAFGAHVKELQRLFVVYSASDDDATRVIAHVNGRLPLAVARLMSDGDVLQTTYMELTPQTLHLAFFRARPLSKVPEQALAFVDFLEALSRVAAACAELPGACDFSHPLSIEDALEIAAGGKAARGGGAGTTGHPRRAGGGKTQERRVRRRAHRSRLRWASTSRLCGRRLPLLSRMRNRYRSPRRRCGGPTPRSWTGSCGILLRASR